MKLDLKKKIQYKHELPMKTYRLLLTHVLGLYVYLVLTLERVTDNLNDFLPTVIFAFLFFAVTERCAA